VGLCKGCKWWNHAGQWFTDKRFYMCMSAGLRDVSSAGLPGHTDEPRKPDMLLHSDVEMYGSTVYTGPDFGCVHFEKGE